VLVVIIGIVGVPAVGTACELWCSTVMDHGSDPCHDGDDGGPRVESRHGCSHSPDAVRAFVPTAHERLASPVASPGTVAPLSASPDMSDTRHGGGAHDCFPPGEAVAFRLVLASVLRV
jgi:hypothetical protein